jgi:hypothetical protein
MEVRGMVGTAALEVLRNVLEKSAPGAELELRRVPPAPNLQQRLEGEGIDGEFSRARALSHDEGIPFWHSVFRIGASEPGGVRQAVLDAALYSQSTERFAYVPLGDDFLARADQLVNDSPSEEYIVASSCVLTDAGQKHFVMLDFSVKERWAGAVETAAGAARALGVSGTLLTSGRSFHFIGDELATWDAYSRFLYRALLLVPVVDERWVAHQLMAGNATLRVSPNSQGVIPSAIVHV